MEPTGIVSAIYMYDVPPYHTLSQNTGARGRSLSLCFCQLSRLVLCYVFCQVWKQAGPVGNGANVKCIAETAIILHSIRKNDFSFEFEGVETFHRVKSDVSEIISSGEHVRVLPLADVKDQRGSGSDKNQGRSTTYFSEWLRAARKYFHSSNAGFHHMLKRRLQYGTKHNCLSTKQAAEKRTSLAIFWLL